VVVDTRIDEKEVSQYPELQQVLAKKGITLEKVIDVEFFEYFKCHENYLANLNESIEDKLTRYSDHKPFIGKLSHKDLVRKLYESEFSEFEEVFLG